jgi:hypothetical protein
MKNGFYKEKVEENNLNNENNEYEEYEEYEEFKEFKDIKYLKSAYTETDLREILLDSNFIINKKKEKKYRKNQCCLKILNNINKCIRACFTAYINKYVYIYN